MACKSVTLMGIHAKCDTATGGIKRVLIAQQDDVVDKVVDRYDAETNPTGEDVIKTITMAEGKYFVEWEFRKNTANYSTSMTSDPTLGNVTITTDLNLQFTKAEAKKRMEIQSAINAAAVVIIEDMNKQFIFLGYDNEVTVTAVNQQSGTAMSDLNGYTLTLQDTSTELPYFVDSTIIPSLLTTEV